MREYLLVFFVAAAATYLLGGLVRRLAAKVGAVTPIRERDVHAVPIPRLGGVSILGGIAVAFVVATNLPFLGMISDVSRDAWVILAAGAVMALVGAIDDVVELDAITKLAGQLVAAGIVVVSGIQLNWLPLPGGALSLGPELSAVISTLLLVGTANAVNFVDGLDGLAAGIVCIGAAAFASYSYVLALTPDLNLNRAATPTLVTAAIAGGCLGFLPHNGFPARIFMGDAGALMLGLMLAASAISLTGWFDPSVLPDSTSLLPALLPMVLPIAVLTLPFMDMMLAVVRRTRKGMSPMAADDQHLHHRMLRIGHSHPRAVLIMYVWAALIAFGMVVLGLGFSWMNLIAVLIAAAVAIGLTMLIPDRKGGGPHPR